jgi:hypothetical protein
MIKRHRRKLHRRKEHRGRRAALQGPRQIAQGLWALTPVLPRHSCDLPCTFLLRVLPIVILSKEFALRSKANPQSKDPFRLNVTNPRAFESNLPRHPRSQLTTNNLCEQTMNSTCGKRVPHPRIKPVIVEDTTCCVSLLTGTIGGSNFAIP